jgi:hypothetical protein
VFLCVFFVAVFVTLDTRQDGRLPPQVRSATVVVFFVCAVVDTSTRPARTTTVSHTRSFFLPSSPVSLFRKYAHTTITHTSNDSVSPTARTENFFTGFRSSNTADSPKLRVMPVTVQIFRKNCLKKIYGEVVTRREWSHPHNLRSPLHLLFKASRAMKPRGTQTSRLHFLSMKGEKKASAVHHSTDPQSDVARARSWAAIYVQDFDAPCVLQFAWISALCCALHRSTSLVIHRSGSYIIYNDNDLSLSVFLPPRRPTDSHSKRERKRRRTREVSEKKGKMFQSTLVLAVLFGRAGQRLETVGEGRRMPSPPRTFFISSPRTRPLKFF